MSKPANKLRGEVAIPEAGKDCFLRFSNDAMERLYSEYGEQYVDDVIRKIGAANPQTFKVVLECMLEGEANIDDRPWGMSWNDLNERILDAVFLSLHNRTFKEHQDFLAKEREKKLDEAFSAAKENPQRAALQFSKLFAELGLLPNSDQTKSEE